MIFIWVIAFVIITAQSQVEEPEVNSKDELASAAKLPYKLTRPYTSTFDLTQAEKDDVVLAEENPEWLTLLSNIPVSVVLLGHLLILSTQKQLSLSGTETDRNFTFISHPQFFSSTILQITQEAWKAFLAAHTSMQNIKEHMKLIPKCSKLITDILVNGTLQQMANSLPKALDELKDISTKCEHWAEATKTKFSNLTNLLYEVLEVSVLKKGQQEGVIGDLKSELSASRASEQKLLEAVELYNKTQQNASSQIVKNKDSYDKEVNESLAFDPGDVIQIFSKSNKSKWHWIDFPEENQTSDGQATQADKEDLLTRINGSMKELQKQLLSLVQDFLECWKPENSQNHSKCDFSENAKNLTASLKTESDLLPKSFSPEASELSDIIDKVKTALRPLGEPSLDGNNYQRMSEVGETLQNVSAEVADALQSIEKNLTNELAEAKQNDRTNLPTNKVDNAFDRLMRNKIERAKAVKKMLAAQKHMFDNAINISMTDLELVDAEQVQGEFSSAIKSLNSLKQNWMEMSKIFLSIVLQTQKTQSALGFVLNYTQIIVKSANGSTENQSEAESEKINYIVNKMREYVKKHALKMNKEAYYLYTISRIYVNISETFIVNRLRNMPKLVEARNETERQILKDDLDQGAKEASEAIDQLARKREENYKKAFAAKKAKLKKNDL